MILIKNCYRAFFLVQQKLSHRSTSVWSTDFASSIS